MLHIVKNGRYRPPNSIINRYRKAKFIRKELSEPIEDFGMIIQEIFDGENQLMEGDEFMCTNIILVGDEDIDTGKNVKCASRYSFINLLLTGYIENHEELVW